MKKSLFVVLITLIAGLVFVGQSPVQATSLQAANLTLTLPDSVTITGSELGSPSNSRMCTIRASIDAQPGTTIPLRGGAVATLSDSTGYSLDSGYGIANVEGLTHLDILFVFHCGNGHGEATIRGPYKFRTNWSGVPGASPFTPDTAVNVSFIPAMPGPTQVPTPIPTVSPLTQPQDQQIQQPQANLNKVAVDNLLFELNKAIKLFGSNSNLTELKNQLSTILNNTDPVEANLGLMALHNRIVSALVKLYHSKKYLLCVNNKQQAGILLDFIYPKVSKCPAGWLKG